MATFIRNMAEISLTPPPPLVLDINTTQQQQKYEKWIENLELYFTAAGIIDSKRKKALLLYLGGEDLRTIHHTLEDDSDTYEKAVEELNTYFVVRINLTFERNIFRNVIQQVDESSKSYITRLKEAAQTCNFAEYSTEAAIIDQFIEKTVSNKLRRKLLGDSKLTLEELIRITTSTEMANIQATAIEKPETSESFVNRIEYKGNRAPKPNDSDNSGIANTMQKGNIQKSRNSMPSTQWRCFGCGGTNHRHGSRNCPASGKQCSFCDKYNHFEKMCFLKKSKSNNYEHSKFSRDSRNVHNIKRESDTSEEEYIFQVRNKQQTDITIRVDGQPVGVLIDSGASVNIVDKKTLEELKKHIKIKLYPTKTKIFAYDSTKPIALDGIFYSNINFKDTHHLARFHVVTNLQSGCILGRHSAMELGLLRLTEEICLLKKQDIEISDVLKEFPSIFKGLGKLKNIQIKFNIDKEVEPVTQHLRRVPFHVRKKVEKKLQEMIEMDVIEEVTESTSWVSPIVAIPKGNDIRLVIDMRKANTAIRRNHYPIPTLEELLQKFNGCKFFSKLDLVHGYHQIELHPQSRYITTFITHNGLFRYKRLVQGATSAFEEYQYHIGTLFKQEQLIQNICDDILVGGRSEEEHKENLRKCLTILEENKLTVNAKKCVWKAQEVTFFGHIISVDGIKPTTDKVDAIKAFPEPRNRKEISSFLGLINYLAVFIRNLSTETAPLRKLLHKDIEWYWGKEESTTFNKLKNLVSSDLVVAHFDADLETILITDAGPIGLGAILTQRQKDNTIKPVAYASKSLSTQERKYSQTEREALGVVWACEKFHLYLYGKHFKILSDHQPLKVLYSPTGKPSPRILRWGLRLQSYDFDIQYIPGHLNPADMLSINPVRMDKRNDGDEMEEYINTIISYATPKAISLSEIIKESENDFTLQKVLKCIKSNEWNFKDDNLQLYHKVRNELTYKSGIILKGERIVIPKALQEKTIRLAHETHLGMVKTKALLRDKVWWPKMNTDIEVLISHCIPCLSMGNSTTEPMGFTDIPMSNPWQKLHIDICGPYPSGEYVLGIIDACSRWPELHVINSTSSEVVINCLVKSFSTHGYPETIVTDNAPNLISVKIEKFCSHYSIHHHKATPYHPQGNSEIERFYRTLSKFVKTTTAEGRNWKKEVYNFLLLYRNTPHCTTTVSPSMMLMNRRLKDKIPCINKESEIVKNAKIINLKKKLKSKDYYDKRNNVKQSLIQEGDLVLMKQKKKGKYFTNFETTPVKVIKVNGTAITVFKNGSPFIRNVKDLKKISKDIEWKGNEDDSDFSEWEPTNELHNNRNIGNENDSEEEDIRNNDPNLERNIEPHRPIRERRSPVRYGDFVRH